jgi:hypothetical protein
MKGVAATPFNSRFLPTTVHYTDVSGAFGGKVFEQISESPLYTNSIMSRTTHENRQHR